jgi:hypothetical protein
MRIDRAIAQEALNRLQPLGVEAALAALETQGQEQSQKRRQVENALEQARFEAARAHRQYDAADPENRLVAGRIGAALETNDSPACECSKISSPRCPRGRSAWSRPKIVSGC